MHEGLYFIERRRDEARIRVFGAGSYIDQLIPSSSRHRQDAVRIPGRTSRLNSHFVLDLALSRQVMRGQSILLIHSFRWKYPNIAILWIGGVIICNQSMYDPSVSVTGCRLAISPLECDSNVDIIKWYYIVKHLLRRIWLHQSLTSVIAS